MIIPVMYAGHYDLMCATHHVRVGGCRCFSSRKQRDMVPCPGDVCPGRMVIPDPNIYWACPSCSLVVYRSTEVSSPTQDEEWCEQRVEIHENLHRHDPHHPRTRA